LGTDARQISGSKCSIDFEHNGEYRRVDISIIIPNDQEFTSEDLAEEYQNKLVEKRKSCRRKKTCKRKENCER
jgi:hypothetical protein